MAASTYKVYLYDIRSQKIYAEIPMSSLSYDYELDGEGSAAVSLPMESLKLDGTVLKPADVFPVRTAIAIQRGSELVWGGLVWQYRVDLTNKMIKIDAGGYFSYYKYRHTYTNGNRFVFKEIIDMIKWFILEINSTWGNGIHTSLSGLVPNGAKRSKSWAPLEYVSIADVIADLADEVPTINIHPLGMVGGFFFHFDPYWVDSTHIGNRMSNTPNRDPDYSGVSLTQGVHCEITEIGVDGNDLANVSYIVGATTNSKTPPAHYELRNPSFSSQLPYMDVIVNANTEKKWPNLYWQAKSALSAGAIPTILPTVITYPNMFSPNQFKTGTKIKLSSGDSFLELNEAEYVITRVAVSVTGDGSDRITMDVVQDELFKEVDTTNA